MIDIKQKCFQVDNFNGPTACVIFNLQNLFAATFTEQEFILAAY